MKYDNTITITVSFIHILKINYFLFETIDYLVGPPTGEEIFYKKGNTPFSTKDLVPIIRSSGFVTLSMMAALIVVPLTGIIGNSFHNIFSYAQTANTIKANQDSLNKTFHSAFDTFGQ